MKKFVTKDRLPDDNQNIEVVELRQEHQTDGEKICIVSQPAGHGDFSSGGHLYLMGYILNNEFVVVTNGLEERGLTLRVSDKFGYASKDEGIRLRNSRDGWKARAERGENLAAVRLTELHARSEEISRVVEERDDFRRNCDVYSKGTESDRKKISDLNSELYAQSEEISRVAEKLERTRDRVSTLNEIAHQRAEKIAKLEEDIESLNQLRGTITSASTWKMIAENRMKQIRLLRDNIDAARNLLQYRSDGS